MEESPISAYIARQQRLDTPVARYAKAQVNGSACATEVTSDGSYRSMIPLTAPKKGEQYAFEVDLDACSGCKACVSACHSLNGLEDSETWRDVGLIVAKKDGSGRPYQQTVTTACHHCEDPGCANGCPVLAYEKDPLTGIVRHLDDQCIGCQYCVMKCPYDVPKYSERLGIVRKCDMCHGRLAENEAPACVKACPTNSIRIVTVPVDLELAASEANPSFPSAFPDQAYTRPTSRYLSKNPVPEEARAADREVLRPQHGHVPLVWMLTLSQVAVGVFAGVGLAGGSSVLAVVGFILLMTGLTASVLHLGRPLGAWRAFLGLRKSWLSREIVVFGGLPPAVFTGAFGEMVGLPRWLVAGALLVAVLVGIVGVFCSAMIYIDTKRDFWRPARSFTKFFGTVVLSLLATLLVLVPCLPLSIIASVGLAGLLAWDWWSLRADLVSPLLQRQQSSRIQMALLGQWVKARFGLGLAALLLSLLSWPIGHAVAIGAALCLLASELCSRLLFFKSVDAPKMPGGLTL